MRNETACLVAGVDAAATARVTARVDSFTGVARELLDAEDRIAGDGSEPD